MKEDNTATKQELFLEKWSSGEGVEFISEDAQKAYQYRCNLIKDAIQLKKAPERVPVVPIEVWAPMDLYGIKPKDAMYNPDILGKTYYDFTLEYDVDATGIAPMVGYGPTLETLEYNLYKWPGGGLSENLTYQFVEKEYMQVEDYDHLIEDPTDFLLRKYMGRICGALKPFSDLAPLYGLQEVTLSNSLFCSLGAPHVQEAFQKLLEAGRHSFEWINKLGPHLGKIIASGYPFCAGGAAKAPFDFIGDSLRGTTPLMMDMYRRPEKVLEACERLVPTMIKMGVGDAMANNNPLVFIPLHKGADGFMSNDQFEKFYWPTLKAVMMGLIDNGCVPICFVEGGYNERLEYLTDVPKGQCVYYFDRTDMAQARKILEGTACIGGGFPISLIVTGDTKQVEDETKKLLDSAAGDGGYILGIGCAMDEAKEDTLKAFINTGKEYGRY